MQRLFRICKQAKWKVWLKKQLSSPGTLFICYLFYQQFQTVIELFVLKIEIKERSDRDKLHGEYQRERGGDGSQGHPTAQWVFGRMDSQRGQNQDSSLSLFFPVTRGMFNISTPRAHGRPITSDSELPIPQSIGFKAPREVLLCRQVENYCYSKLSNEV